MPTLYVTEPRAVVRRIAGTLVVTLDEDSTGSECRASPRRLIEVKTHRLEMIGLVGRVHLTADATRLCLDEGIGVSWLTRRGGFLGRLTPALSRTADLRLRQFRLAEDPEGSLALARLFIEGKLRNAAAMIRMVRSNRPGEVRFAKVIERLSRLRAKLAEAGDADGIRGIEGDGARRYFSVFGLAFSGPIGFAGRKRRPAPDPANALLSFGYVLLANFLTGLLEARGLDPYLGYLHSERSGKPSLALDLIEELRHPVVDRFVLRLCNRRQFLPEHFESDVERGGVRLLPDALRRFLGDWERYLGDPMAGIESDHSVTQAVARQTDRLAAHLRGKTAYEPLLLRGA